MKKTCCVYSLKILRARKAFSLVSLVSNFFFSLIFTFSLRFERTHARNERKEKKTRWLKNLTEEDFLAASVAAATEATDADAVATEAAEVEAVVAAEAAAEGRTKGTSGPRARSWGDWYKRYVYIVDASFD